MSQPALDPMAPIRASTRLHISWGGRPATENADVLVLTIDGVSIDLRVFTSGPEAGSIDWATVGAVSLGEGHSEANPVLKWATLLDNRPPAPTGSEDEGTFTVLSETDVLETGCMYNPDAGKDEAYEEVWRRHRVPAGSEYYVLERVDGDYGANGKGDKERAHTCPRAFIARFGPYALGLARTPQGFVAYRDELDSESGVWTKKYDVGGAALPAPAQVTAIGTGKTGSRMRVGSEEWLVRSAGKR